MCGANDIFPSINVYQAPKVGSHRTLRLTQFPFNMKMSSRSSKYLLSLPCNPTIQHRMLGVGQISFDCRSKGH